ncbi:transposase [Amycolatopsis sp. WAC 01375]|uniref:IS110 family transposase n=1 Tax=Amycolatopsis sp. WAC 01375 TaxID=2203194 RepID=UPI0013156482
MLADLVRTDAHQLREVAGDSDLADGVQGLTRAHQALIWDKTRHVLRLQATLRDYFPAALEAFLDLTGPEALELLSKAPDPERAARLSRKQISAALTRARRRDIDGKAPRSRLPACSGTGPWPGPDRGRGRGHPLADHRDPRPHRRDQHPGDRGESLFWPAP